MAIPRIKYQLIKFQITASGQQVPIDAETDKLYNTVTGINVLLTDGGAIFSSIELDINNVEVFPAGFEVIRIRLRDQAPMGYDYQELNEPAGGSKVKGTYTDDPIGGQGYPYTVTVSIRLENKPTPGSSDTGRL